MSQWVRMASVAEAAWALSWVRRGSLAFSRVCMRSTMSPRWGGFGAVATMLAHTKPSTTEGFSPQVRAAAHRWVRTARSCAADSMGRWCSWV